MDKTVPVIKLKDLPVGTVISDNEHGRYELSAFGLDGDFRVWMEMYAHCEDCTEMVADELAPDFNTGQGSWIQTPSAEYFRNWHVVLVPVEIGADLLDQINKFNEAQIARPYHR